MGVAVGIAVGVTVGVGVAVGVGVGVGDGSVTLIAIDAAPPWSSEIVIVHEPAACDVALKPALGPLAAEGLTLTMPAHAVAAS
ncbi:MAG: hypothetical protein DLM53_10290 [Candidatus Eremiobacter antarcticus]|nr:MAG: hypothetical protein DLM53_10290 [Candidatus Eremiobacter sp. RRmetagenome_bin22]